MTLNRDIHHRQSLRLRDFDYSSDGAYFVTICTLGRESLLGEMQEGTMRLNDMGCLVENCWAKIPHHFSSVFLDEFVIMPNHIHGIMIIRAPDSPGRATHASPLQKPGPKRQSVGAIVGSFKSAASKDINQWRDTPGRPVWQRNYYERIIRDDREMVAIRQYIADNPVQWHLDRNCPPSG